MKIRDILPSDLQFVTPLYMAMYRESKEQKDYIPYPLPSENAAEEFNFFALEQMKMNPLWHCVVAIPQGKVVKGFLVAELAKRRFAIPKTSAIGEILYVDPKFRGQGIATLLIAHMANWAKSMGAEAFEVVFVPGSKAHKMWASAGFRTYQAIGVLADKDWQAFLEAPELKENVK